MKILHLLSTAILARSAPTVPAFGMTADTRDSVSTATALLDKRQGACGTWTTSTGVVGDGNPWQAHLHIQVSLTPASVSITVGSATSGSVSSWISGGFAVEMSIETGKTRACDGGPGKTVFTWKAVRRTAYKVQDYRFNQRNAGEPARNVHEKISPNRNGVGGDFYCGRGDACRNRGDQYV
ncbi:hypothetical protein N657DRAFT_673103 [Parathielavia appendiculata]|uniref:Uncharacterized protein n=1 Tax=Parathielavia appendiculata TaxID=2587402 RepID=A0AAN6TW51_9PEZI|nr:hypothetical protein N657DRAFT_673103 [Parathielavia appendiculata]